MGSVNGAAAALAQPESFEVSSLSSGAIYTRGVAVRNGGDIGAYARLYVTWSWRGPDGSQVALPGGLVALESINDADGGYVWVEAPDGFWDRLPSEAATPATPGAADAAYGGVIPPRGEATAELVLKTGELPAAAEGCNVEVKVFVDLVGEMAYRAGL
jgi:hypothetical protein